MNKHLLSVACLSLVFIFSCKKDDTPKPPTQTVEQLLTAKTWKVEELRLNTGNSTTQFYYKRGGIANSDNRDSDSLKFNANNTGMYYYMGNQYPTKWEFTNADKSKMTLEIQYKPSQTVYWENMSVSENYLSYSQYSLPSAENYVAIVTRIPN